MGLADSFTLLVNYNHADFFRQRFPAFKLIPIKFLPLTLAYKLTSGRFKGTKYLKKLGIFKKTVKKCHFDALWIPYCVDYTYVKTDIPTLCTIHDIYRVHRNGKEGWDFITDENCTLTSVSDYTKNDIIKTFALDEKHASSITKIPNSIVFDVSKQSEIADLAGKKYILDINAYIGKKNPMTLLKAFNLIKNNIKEVLFFCGGYKDEVIFAEMQEFIAKNDLNDRVKMLFRVSDEERNWLLTHATLFVTPSLFEGFGRTPVEAAICKIPVISTKETSLYEATMGLCNYVEDAKDENELASLMLKKLESSDSAEKLEHIAHTLSENYEPINLAKKYLEILRKN
ncbi:MAG: glycosyltransferase [Treponemataceae bacterium]|nr:glycosyltransferase [Treponemataceae bacterium]